MSKYAVPEIAMAELRGACTTSENTNDQQLQTQPYYPGTKAELPAVSISTRQDSDAFVQQAITPSNHQTPPAVQEYELHRTLQTINDT